MIRYQISDRIYDIRDWMVGNLEWDLWGGYNPITNPLNWIYDLLDRLGSFMIYGEVPRD